MEELCFTLDSIFSLFLTFEIGEYNYVSYFLWSCIKFREQYIAYMYQSN